MNFVERGKRQATKFLRVHFFADRHRADQMMRRLCARRLIGLRSQKIETAINLKRIGVDNLGIDVVCEIGRELGFPGRGWANDEKDARHQFDSTTGRRTQPFENRAGRRAAVSASSPGCESLVLTSCVMLARFRAADHKFAAKEFFVVQFRHGALGFIDGLHLHEGEPFRALVVPVTHHLCVLHVANAVEQFEEVALGGVEGKVADVKTRRTYLNRFRLARRPRGLRAIGRRGRWLFCAFVAVVSKKCGDSLPECFLGSLRARFLVTRAIAPSSGPAARTARASPG